MKNDENKKPVSKLPGTGEAYKLHGPLSEEERRIEEGERQDKERYDADTEFKKRQLNIADKQTAISSRMAVYTLVLAVLSIIGNAISIWNANNAGRAAVAAESAANTTRENFIVSQRPWIKVNYKITVPLTFNSSGQLPAGMEATFNVLNAERKSIAFMAVERSLENVGPTVAVGVLAWQDVITVVGDNIDGAKAIQRNWCDAHRNPNPGITGLTLFPHDPVRVVSSMGPTMESVVDAMKRESPELKSKISFVLAGCVCYKAPFERLDAPTHQTRFIYPLGETLSAGFQPYVAPTGTARQLTIITSMPLLFTAD